MLVRAESVTKSFGPKDILAGVNMQINEGDRIALVGPNGAGKTTLIKILMGEVRPDTGEVTIRTAKICYLSQFPVVDSEDTVHETLTQMDPATEEKMERLKVLESIMASGTLPKGMDWNDLANEYSNLQEEVSAATNGEMTSRTKETLEQVGLSLDKSGDKLAHLSGGEKTKVMLAKVLSQAEKADLLILDEPTSHLDIDAVEWLEDYLLEFKGAVLVVSHDRYFLDRVATQVYELDNGKTRNYGGNYSQFVDKKALDMERQRKEFEKNQLERERHTRIAEQQHQMLWFSSTHKTRLKMLERLGQKEPPKVQKDLKVMIPTAQKSGKNVVIARKLKVSYGNKVILKDVDLDIDAGEKLGIFGQNGAGKTTLVKALLGELPSRGDLWVAPGAEIGYYAQGHDKLENFLTPLEQINKCLGGNDRARARFLLARFLLTEKEVERPIETLSGGERGRVALAMLIAEKRNLLVLDEPTNYLDIMAKHAVESALADFPGTLMIITHDRYLLDSVCSKVAEVHNGGVTIFNGSYSEYKGARTGRNAVEEAEVYKVISGFTEWVSKKKYVVGDKVLVAPSEKESFQWALDNGKMKRMPGKERKIIKK